MKLLLVAVVIHVLFLLSIFYIHFQSPILKGLPDGAEHDQPPADRLVLFVGDGLRAESFLKFNLNRTTFLRNILLNEGVFGIANTRVPTESRPGHAALLGGVYEDPSAVFRGWKENPVEFDSVLNRSSVSYCWGSPDIVHMFSRGAIPGRVHVAAYDSNDESFAQSANTSLLDIWVFDRVRQFLSGEQTERVILSQKKVILFLHLLGLDTAGHVHKPHSDLFTENLIAVDKGIESIVGLIEHATENDGKTAFIFTSDHGMTDQGSHGAGDPHETETPFLAWGAGFKHWKETIPAPDNDHVLELNKQSIPVHHINQADAAPLMAAVLGISVPKNSLGRLPRSLLRVSEEYAAWAMRNNAEQLLSQYYRWQRQSEGKMLQWLISTKQTGFKVLIEALQAEIADAAHRKHYTEVQSLCKMLIDTTLNAIEYFQSYYKPHLFVALTLTMLGWVFLLARETCSPAKNRVFAHSRTVAFAAVIVAVAVVLFNIAQDTPTVVILYFVIPITIWGYIGSYWRQYAPLLQGKAVMYSAVFIVAAEALVLAFLDRRILAPLLWVHCLLVLKPLLNRNALKTISRSVALQWIGCNLLLSGFFLLPSIGRDNSNVFLLCLSIVLWALTNTMVLSVSKNSPVYKAVALLVQILQAMNFCHLIYLIERSSTVPQWSRSLCWIFSTFGLLLPFCTTTSIPDRILALFGGLSGPYMMLSLSYEPLFLLCFYYTLYLWLYVENITRNKQIKLADFYFTSTHHTEGNINFEHTRRTFGFMLFLLACFFGTGNLATVSSFDPNWVRCFVTTFSPFTMMALIVLKLLIPVLLLVCVLKAMGIICSVHKMKIFSLTLIVCDWMCLNFFFMVQNKGSWMDIGSSISHFVILECTTIVVMMLYELVRLVTEVSLAGRNPRSRQLPEQLMSSQYLPYSNKERSE
ncbi:GPI ethanolamine phosphate transferase 1 [Anopheles marshallii]|uniref:GPI ethanolamine phosphate transferase 1 n=1 Tax=Anopheles marshallii TaxID=1521116 RepID=UPI00237A6F3A|nr:GPI ethanolamine phosphate transferase 1 [Anopheles marshallii]